MSAIVKIIAIGDLHFQTVNRLQTDVSTKSILNTVKECNPDFIVILGDVLHKFSVIDMDPLNRFRQFLLKLVKVAPVYILVGNHDMRNNRVFLTTDHALNVFKAYEDVVVCDKPKIVRHSNLEFVMCPYTPPGKFRDALDTINSDKFNWRNASTIFAHQEFQGVQMNDIHVSEDGDKWLKKYPLVVSGHIHKRHWFKKGRVYYTGSAIQHTFAEDCDKTIAYITYTRDSPPVIQELPVPGINKKLVEMNVESANDWKPDSNSIDKTIWRLVVKDTPALITTFKKGNGPDKLKQLGVEVKYQAVFSTTNLLGIDTESITLKSVIKTNVFKIFEEKVDDTSNDRISTKYKLLRDAVVV